MRLSTQFHKNEKEWIKRLLSEDFKWRSLFVTQLEHAKVKREYTDYYLSMQFEIDKADVEPIKTKERVPLEMRVFKPNLVPIQFLLHVIDGYISELEIFNADSTRISAELALDAADRIELFLSDEIKIE